jgi:hypothetical protein
MYLNDCLVIVSPHMPVILGVRPEKLPAANVAPTPSSAPKS